MIGISVGLFKKLSLGYKQTWQDVKANRILGINYTNNTGKPIFINVALYSRNNHVYLYVDDLIVDRGYDNTSAYVPLTAIVPSGSTYKVSGAEIKLFTEFR